MRGFDVQCIKVHPKVLQFDQTMKSRTLASPSSQPPPPPPPHSPEKEFPPHAFLAQTLHQNQPIQQEHQENRHHCQQQQQEVYFEDEDDPEFLALLCAQDLECQDQQQQQRIRPQHSPVFGEKEEDELFRKAAAQQTNCHNGHSLPSTSTQSSLSPHVHPQIVGGTKSASLSLHTSNSENHHQQQKQQRDQHSSSSSSSSSSSVPLTFFAAPSFFRRRSSGWNA